jgi:3-hydroxyisobutyrate dehydrogenase
MTHDQNIGFIGLGAMGGAIARRLLAQGFSVTCFDLDVQAVEALVSHGAMAADRASQAVAGHSVVITSLPTPEIVGRFWDEHAEELDEGAIAVDASTVDPATSRREAACVESHPGRRFVACTVGRTPAHAERGEIPAFVGGDPQAVDELRPVLMAMANEVFPLGSVEAATMFKLISNLVGMTNLVALAEGYSLASRMGIDADTFERALRTTGAWSSQAEIRLAWMAQDDLDARFSVDLAAKDLRLSVDAAARNHVPVHVCSSALQVFVLAQTMGYGRLDAGAVIRAVEPLIRQR